ncbi:MAG: SusD/RagB family nutrient-binding outer membrane lipoprotein [Bacteroides sp.]|nr:SusD/RagB family nutrient-binding outer membrane lipoprotein [Bacteroides sp.]
MKKIKYIGLCLVLVSGFASCSLDNWLDVNENPNTPTQEVASLSSRLPWIEHHYGYAAGTAGFRAGYVNGMLTAHKGITKTTDLNYYMPYWDVTNGISTTPYQHWFVGAACNLDDLIKSAEEEGAYHYIGAAYVIRAMGFMLMADWYGECPYTEALGAYLTPKYDTGQTIFEGCLADLDKALPYFDKTQEPNATPLKDGDSWNNGDIGKWKALIY